MKPEVTAGFHGKRSVFIIRTAVEIQNQTKVLTI
jgi:hypothetical protein